MKIDPQRLESFKRSVPPPPPPVEPRLPIDQEVALIVGKSPDDGTAHARRERVQQILRRPATPEGDDASLFIALAKAKSLPIDGRSDWIQARQRLAELGEEALLPVGDRFGPGDFDPGVYPGISSHPGP